jgi:hypothetical protein
MVDFNYLDLDEKRRVLDVWATMSESGKTHFINQVALALSVWGDDVRGKRLVIEVIRDMANNETKTLADFGIYAKKVEKNRLARDRSKKMKRAILVLEGYRIRHGLSSVTHKDIGI